MVSWGFLEEIGRASDRLLERRVVVEVGPYIGVWSEGSVTKCVCCTMNADEVPAEIQVIL